MPLPDPAHHAGGDLDALQHQLLRYPHLRDPHRPVARMGQRVIEDGGLDRLGQPVGMWSARPGQPIDQTGRAVSLEVAADLVELLAAVADQLAGLGHITEVRCQLQQAQLAACYLLFRGHVALRQGG